MDEREDSRRRRRVRSFVQRAGRITPGQRRALRELWPRFGLDMPVGTLDLDAVFGRHAPHVAEIGFGDGEVLVKMATEQPSVDFLGIEVHEPGVGHCLLRLKAANLDNVRLIRHDAVEVLQSWLDAQSLDRVHLFFPDPWPKKRHHKRRLLQPSFANLLGRVLKPGGIAHIATDWPDYAAHIEAVMGGCADFKPVAGPNRPLTRFERRGQRLGHPIRDLAYRRLAARD